MKKQSTKKTEQKQVDAPKLKLTPAELKQCLEIRDDLLSKEMGKSYIRKEIFKKLGIDITLYEFDWKPEKKVSHKPVDSTMAIERTHDIRTSKEPITFKHNYTEQEINEMARSMSNVVIEQNDLEEQKKNVMADYKQKIDVKQEQINSYSRRINTGFEMKNEICELVKDFKSGIKKAFYNGQLVMEEKMTQADYTLPFPTGDSKEVA